MLEAEWAWTQEIGDVCDLTEACIKNSLVSGDIQKEQRVLGKGIPAYEERLRCLEDAAGLKPWTRMTYADAVAELDKYHVSQQHPPFRFAPKWGHPLQSEHERWLSEVLIQGPVFVMDYPSLLKPFYMRTNDDSQTVACFDLLVPHVGELAGGSLREERLGLLRSRMGGLGLDPDGEEYRWYLELRRFGSAPHAGFGMGFERLVSWVSGIENIRECIAMPRWTKRMLL